MTAEIVRLNESNFRDPVATFRAIVNEIEAGDSGEVVVAFSPYQVPLAQFQLGAFEKASGRFEECRPVHPVLRGSTTPTAR